MMLSLISFLLYLDGIKLVISIIMSNDLFSATVNINS
jgi:hypothetical protein